MVIKNKTSLVRTPGFRFHPTDVELVKYYLKRKVLGMKISFNAIDEVDIYKHAPWDLPVMSSLKTGDRKWFFFCPNEKKYARGARLKRSTVHGYWKTTGKDRAVQYNEEVVGSKKSLVFHLGKAPGGKRTDWIMHEYSLKEKELADRGVVQDSYVLCVVFEKEGKGCGNGAQYRASFNEEDWSDDDDVDQTTSHSGVSKLTDDESSGLMYSSPMAVLHSTNATAPQVSIVADSVKGPATPALMESTQVQVEVQESEDHKIDSTLELFTQAEADALDTGDDAIDDFLLDFPEVPYDVLSMLAPLTEDNNFNNV